MRDRWDVLGFGAVAVDDLLYVERYPPPNTKTPVRATRRVGGGLVGTALVTATRLGARAAYAGVLGEDHLSGFTRDEFSREGVDCSPCLFQKGARPIHSIVVIEEGSGQRNIFYSYEGVIERDPDDSCEDLVRSTRVLLLDHTSIRMGLAALEVAKRHSIPVVGDVEDHVRPGVTDLIKKLDHLILGHELARSLTGESEPPAMLRSLLCPQRACTAITVGERGCWYAEGKGPIRHQRAFRVHVVDTTGCGDVFHGAYAACIAQGMEVAAAIELASAAAALKATQPGGRSGIPDRATLERFLQEVNHATP